MHLAIWVILEPSKSLSRHTALCVPLSFFVKISGRFPGASGKGPRESGGGGTEGSLGPSWSRSSVTVIRPAENRGKSRKALGRGEAVPPSYRGE